MGITIQTYHKQMAKQQGLCYICKDQPAVALDHNHITGEFRAILCNSCNLLVGWVEKSTHPNILMEVKNYIDS